MGDQYKFKRSEYSWLSRKKLCLVLIIPVHLKTTSLVSTSDIISTKAADKKNETSLHATKEVPVTISFPIVKNCQRS